MVLGKENKKTLRFYSLFPIDWFLAEALENNIAILVRGKNKSGCKQKYIFASYN